MKKLLSISLACLLFLSSVGVMYSTHYCFGRKVKSGFTQDKNAMNCLMALSKTSNDCDKQNSFQNKSCCDNESVSIETDSEFSSAQVELEQFVFLGLFVHTYNNINSLELNSEVVKPYNTPPPIVKSDYQSAHQVYII